MATGGDEVADSLGEGCGGNLLVDSSVELLMRVSDMDVDGFCLWRVMRVRGLREI